MKINLTALGITSAVLASIGWDLVKRLAVRSNRGIAKGKRFVVLGGGFAGVEVVRELERLLPGADNGEIVLVDKNDYLLFTPMLTEAVGGGIQSHHIIVPLETFIRRSQLVTGEVRDISLRDRTVVVEEGGEPQKLTADQLVICLGASSNFHHLPGVEQSSIELKTLDDANLIREGALELLKGAAQESNPEERAAMLTFVVAGGGYTGVEAIAALNDFLQDTAAEYGAISASEIRMVLVEPMERIMSEVTEDLAGYAQKQLEAAGVRVLLKTGIKGASGDTVELTNGEKIRTRTLIWTAGVEANKLVGDLDAPRGKSKALKVTPELALQEFAGVWVAGDSAEIPEPNGKGHYGMTAQNATREGKLLARNIVHRLKGEPLKPFRYTPIGELAVVGKQRGVARVYGFNFSGFLAYVMWRLVYIAKLPSMTQRSRVLADWCLDLLLGPVAKIHYVAASPTRDRLAARQRLSASA